jgi:ectoine hydroxylase
MITKEQIKQYRSEGYLLFPEYFTEEEISIMAAELPAMYAEESQRRVMEKDGKTVRGIHGCHKTNDVFRRLVRLPKFLNLAEQLLGGSVYVHQFKINAKQGMGGEVWEWHQDFTFWQLEDGMPEPKSLSMAIFINEVTEFNGPLLFYPGSHKEGMRDVYSSDSNPPEYADKESWISTLTARLKHGLSKDDIKQLALKYGIVAPKGPAGSLLIFDPLLVHGSVQNISPFDRNLVIVSYNRTENALQKVPNPRPEFIASRDFTPLKALDYPSLQSTDPQLSVEDVV